MTELIRGFSHLTLANQPYVVTIGNFDGVHQGHLAVIRRLQQQGVQQKLPTCIILFEPHPQEFFLKGKAPARLMQLREKITIFRQLGVDRVLCLPFQKIVALSAEAFVLDILIKRLGMACLIIGDDFRFGKGRQGDYTQLQKWAQRYHFILEAMPTTCFAGKRVGSSWVREALRQGDFSLAAQLLTRPFQFSGRVIRGDQRGRLLGFPTANLALKRQVVPLSGVFAVRIHGLGASYLGVANCGTRPTVSGNKTLLEVHLFDFNDDIYGKRIEVELVEKIRDEKHFDSLEALRQQIQQDSESAKKRLIAF
jgi:riboflavin kinase / FMN adenylyltransferase